MLICEIVSVGTELVLGNTEDTNATFLSARLRALGWAVKFRQTCGDHLGRLTDTLRLALSRSDCVIVTGGLGPTYDDITRDALAALLGKALSLREESVEEIRAYFAGRGRPMSENNLRQAMIPEGAEPLRNLWGTAPGIRARVGEKEIFLLPGVPREMKAMFEAYLAPALAERSGGILCTRILRLFGIGESVLDEKLSAVLRESVNPSVAPFAGEGEVSLHVTCSAETQAEANGRIEEKLGEILSVVEEYLYGEGEDTLASVLISRFGAQGLTLAAAESCTGGLLSQMLTAVPGSSAVLQGGVVAYTEEIKEKVLGVSRHMLTEQGVYSLACAEKMAEGARRLCGSSLGIGITGVAGPDGGTEENPVGTVYIAVSGKSGCVSERFLFPVTADARERIRLLSAKNAMAMALKYAHLFQNESKKQGNF
ncbi:MAG: competence/damage-inducible protein A [Clostridia bacterium]|nr:competence/damage-inducible protein A [Clostridia bacterium]